jgi:membrane protease YdiL (CAAX protease family)
MRPVRSLLIYIAVVFVGGALLAPWLHALVQQLQDQFPALEKFAHNPFHRYVNRSLLVLAVLGLWPLLRSLGLKNFRELGLGNFRLHWKSSLAGFGIGFISLAIVAGCAIAFEARDLKPTPTTEKLLKHLLNATTAALAVSLLEEILFRGAIFGAFRKIHSWFSAMILSSAIYALVHFFARPAPLTEIDWTSGFVTLGQMLVGFTNFQTLIPGFINLFLAGCILAVAVQFTGRLFFSIGLHAGWIFWLKSYGFISREAPGANTWFWGTGKLIDGWAASIVITLVLTVILITKKRHNSQTCQAELHQP